MVAKTKTKKKKKTEKKENHREETVENVRRGGINLRKMIKSSLFLSFLVVVLSFVVFIVLVGLTDPSSRFRCRSSNAGRCCSGRCLCFMILVRRERDSTQQASTYSNNHTSHTYLAKYIVTNAESCKFTATQTQTHTDKFRPLCKMNDVMPTILLRVLHVESLLH